MSSRQKVALVTGASSGIGYATAIELAKRGYKVFAGARRLDPMEPLREHGILIVELDVTSEESVQQVKKVILEETGHEYLDVLFNNAGQPCVVPAIDLTPETIERVYAVNVFGAVRVTRILSPLVINAKGVIGFTGSVSGLVQFPWSAAYSSSKSAIHQYAATLRLEMKPFGVKVINLVTGGVKTNISDTRPIPEGSLYAIPALIKAFVFRQQMAVRNNPMSPAKYAYQVANDFEAATVGGKFNLYRGTLATTLYYFHRYFPLFLIERLLIRKFHLAEGFKVLRDKYSKVKAA